jgi:prepilin-type N-terminal cleavage/methylation domain-containing protein
LERQSKPKGSKGLTLIEVAIVLVILGLLLGLGAGLVGMLTKRAKIVESREIVDAAVEAVKGYTIMNGRLPNYSNFTTIVRSLYDAWQKPLVYIYDGNASNKSICDLTKTAITVRFCFNTDCSSYNETQYVAFIVLSGGPNYNIQTAGSQEVSSNTTIRVYQQGVDNVDNYSGDFNRPEPFDDIVKYATLYELQSLLKCPSTPPPSNCTYGTSPIQLLTQDRIFYCYYDTNYTTECDNQAGACSELKKNELLSLEPNDKLRIYRIRRGNKCKTEDALTVNANPCLGYRVSGCFDIQTADGNRNCQVQGYISGNNYVIQDR